MVREVVEICSSMELEEKAMVEVEIYNSTVVAVMTMVEGETCSSMGER